MNTKYQGHTPGPWYSTREITFSDDANRCPSGHSVLLDEGHGFFCPGCAIAPVKADNATLLARVERLGAACSGALTALRLARDSEPERWDALMGSRIGPEVATAWDKLKAALAREE